VTKKTEQVNFARGGLYETWAVEGETPRQRDSKGQGLQKKKMRQQEGGERGELTGLIGWPSSRCGKPSGVVRPGKARAEDGKEFREVGSLKERPKGEEIFITGRALGNGLQPKHGERLQRGA